MFWLLGGGRRQGFPLGASVSGPLWVHCRFELLLLWVEIWAASWDVERGGDERRRDGGGGVVAVVLWWRFGFGGFLIKWVFGRRRG